jgi:hypothetical protein
VGALKVAGAGLEAAAREIPLGRWIPCTTVERVTEHAAEYLEDHTDYKFVSRKTPKDSA